MAGYSDKPLLVKLGIKPGFRVTLIDPPRGFKKELGTLPSGVKLEASLCSNLDFILLFVSSETELKKKFPPLAANLCATGMMWIAWPKKSSGVTTDLSFANVQQIGLAAGLVDVKICAVNEIWSGLKFVYRLKDRAKH